MNNCSFINYFYLYFIMIAQRNKDKENIPKPEAFKSGNMLYQAIDMLKQDKQNLVRQNEQRERYHEEEKKKLRIQIEGYKKKIVQLTQANILANLVKKEPATSKNQTEIMTKVKRLELEVDHFKKIISDREKTIENKRIEIKELEKKYKLLHEQKEKHLEISLTQKIMMDEKVELLEKEVRSKKNLIDGLRKEIQKINKIEFEVSKKQRQIVKRGREMNRYQEEFQSYYLENEKKYLRKIEGLQSQNNFLRKQIKKIAKKVKTTCQCEGEAQEWKQKLYQVGRQLARARVELGRADISKEGSNSETKKKIKQARNPNFRSDNQQSLESLTLSQQSSCQENFKATQKKR